MGRQILAVGGPEVPSEPTVDLRPALPAPLRTTTDAAGGAESGSEPAAGGKDEAPLANTQVRASRSTARIQRTEFARPCDGRVTSSYGPRWGRMHTGLDLGSPFGAPVRAVTSGTVKQSGYSGGYGKLTVLQHSDGTETYYAHQSKILVRAGETVLAGDTIGLIGSTGNSTGPHLHFEVRPAGGAQVNPRVWLSERGIDF